MLRLVNQDILFPIPLFSFELAGAAELNARLKPEIFERMAAEQSVTRSNRGGWHSASDLFAREEPAHRDLARHCIAALKTCSERSIPGLDWGRVELFCDGWVNVSDGHDQHIPHDHPNAFWAGVYYVEVPEQDGFIEFLSGRGGNPYASLVSAPMSWDYLRLQPVSGSAIIFPGHVKHWVPPSPGRGRRISIAFNAGFRPSAA
jgi:uncharacterized protein (TIGR02466 family)